MKPNTKTRQPQTVGIATVLLIERTLGARAAIARLGGFDRSYVSKVLNGQKPASERFSAAVAEWVHRFCTAAQARLAASEVHCVKPQIDESSGKGAKNHD